MAGNVCQLQRKLELERRKLKNKLAIILDEMDMYAKLKMTDDVEMNQWYTRLREVHDVCLLIDFIEDILELQ